MTVTATVSVCPHAEATRLAVPRWSALACAPSTLTTEGTDDCQRGATTSERYGPPCASPEKATATMGTVLPTTRVAEFLAATCMTPQAIKSLRPRAPRRRA